MEQPNSSDALRQIPLLVRRYAMSRPLLAWVFVSLFCLPFLCLGPVIYFGGQAKRAGHTGLMWFWLGLAIPCYAALLWLAVPRWGGRRLQERACQLRASEGTVALAGSCAKLPRQAARWVGVVFGFCVLATVALGMFFDLPTWAMQPISAIYLIPFVVLIVHYNQLTAWAYLFPVLYGVHAVALLAGAPIRFTGAWTGLDIAFPMCAYSGLTALIGYLTSRQALHKLRRIAGSGH